MGGFRGINRILCKIELIVMILWLASIFVIICLQVLMRYVLRSPLVWSEEYSRYSFVWISYIGCAYCVGVNHHTRIMFLFDKLPRLGQRALRVLTNIVGVFTFVYIIPRALVYAVKNYRFVTSIMRIPMTHLYLVLTVGGILTVVHLLLDTILAFGRDQIPEESAL